MGVRHAAWRGKVFDSTWRLTVEQAGQEHHLVRGGCSIGIEQGDLEIVLAITLDRERTTYRQVDDRCSRFPGINLAVDQ